MKNNTPSVSRYFTTTLLMFLLVPNLLFIPFAAIALAASGVLDNTVFSVAIASLGVVLFCFMAYNWGKKKTNVSADTAAENSAFYRIGWVYFPVLIPLIYQCVLSFICMIFESGSAESVMGLTAAFLGVLLSFDFYGSALALTVDIPPVIGHLILNAAYILCFALGERHTAKEYGIKRTFKPAPFILTGSLLAAVFGICCFGKWYHELGRVELNWDDLAETNGYYDENPETRYGYGFPYENGWSSVDLEPYYPENPDNILAQPSAEPTLRISDPQKMPRLDGAEAAYPIYAAFAAACYDNIGEIQTAEKAKLTDDDKRFSSYRRGGTPVCFTNTIEAFKGLADGDVDIFFGAQPSAQQRELAEKAGKTLVLTPIGKEAFVFMVSPSNPVDGLTSEQIRDIYSGKITNWVSVGGLPAPVLAFQRPENSGSQTMMKYFMGDTPLKEPVQGEYYSMMEGVIRATASYRNKLSSIGYSFRYYAQQMGSDSDTQVKLLALDGVYPDKEHIASGEYPMTTMLYAITLAENDNKYIQPMLDWMTGEQGQEIIEKTGYVPVS